MTTTYHYGKNGQTHGPVSLDRLRQMVASGELTRTDFVIPAGGKEWLTADKVLGPASAPAPKVDAPRAARPAAVVSSKAEGGFRYKRDGQDYGPVGLDELKRMAAAGKVRATDLVSEDGGPWKPAARHRGVFAGRRCEANGVTFLHPKDWWVTVTPSEESREMITFTIENKHVSMTLGVYPQAITPEKGLNILRGTVENNSRVRNPSFGKATAQVGGERAEGYEYEFDLMGTRFVGRMYAVGLHDRTMTFMFQASDERFASIRLVAELIRGSLAVAV